MSLQDTNPSGLKLICISYIFTTLASICVGLRLYARRITHARIGWSDYFIMMSLLCAIIYTICATITVAPSSPGSEADHAFTSAKSVVWSKLITTEEFLWLIATSCTKLSVLHFLYSIFHRKSSFATWVYTLKGLVGVYTFSFFVAGFFTCTPFSLNWDPSVPGNCNARLPIWVTASILSLVLDLAIFILPLPFLWKLQMNVARKLAVSAVFGVGTVVCIIAIMRSIVIYRISLPISRFTIYDGGTWSMLDMCLGNINACLPLMPPAIRLLSGKDVFAWTRHLNPSPSSSKLPARNDSRVPEEFSTLGYDSRNHSIGLPPAAVPPNGAEGALGRDRLFNPAILLPPHLRNVESRSEISGASSPSVLISSAPRSPSQGNASAWVESRNEQRTGTAGGSERASTHRHGNNSLVGVTSLIAGRITSRLGSKAESLVGSRADSRAGDHDDDDAGGLVELQSPLSNVSDLPDHDVKETEPLENSIVVTTKWGVNIESAHEPGLETGNASKEEEAKTAAG